MRPMILLLVLVAGCSDPPPRATVPASAARAEAIALLDRRLLEIRVVSGALCRSGECRSAQPFAVECYAGTVSLALTGAEWTLLAPLDTPLDAMSPGIDELDSELCQRVAKWVASVGR